MKVWLEKVQKGSILSLHILILQFFCALRYFSLSQAQSLFKRAAVSLSFPYVMLAIFHTECRNVFIPAFIFPPVLKYSL